MRQLSGCDFCGGTASGTFEVLPPERDPGGVGKRMLLCDHCRDALASILDPLLDGDAARPTPAEDAARASGDPASDRTVDTATDDGPTSTDGQAAENEPATDDTTMASTGAGRSSRVPKGYRKVLRFLENRDLPIERAAAVEMAAGAYDLDEDAVDAAIDHAVSHGRLKAFDGELRRA